MILVLMAFIFLAAFIDSIAGGGALIALPAYYAFGIPPHIALGTNKFAASLGTLMATVRFVRSKSIHWQVGIIASVFAILGAAVGANMALKLDERYLQLMMLVAVPVLAVVVLTKKDLGENRVSRFQGKAVLIMAAVIGLVIGWYDGFFGPAAGTFYTLAFTAVLGMTMTDACGTTKLVNLASGMSALVMFIVNGKIDFAIAVPCACAAIAGNWVGSGLAIKNGAKIVRPIMVNAMALLLLKVAADLFL